MTHKGGDKEVGVSMRKGEIERCKGASGRKGETERKRLQQNRVSSSRVGLDIKAGIDQKQ